LFAACPLCDHASVPAHIVVVEDEPVTRTLFTKYLQNDGFRVSQAEGTSSLNDLLRAGDVDLVLLDVELSGEHGFQIGAVLRATSNVGLIFVTKRGDAVDRIVGLELGADDYVTKPPDMRELVARVRAVLRRRTLAPTRTVTPFGKWSFDRARHCLVGANAEETALTQGEIAVLVQLLEAEGRVVSRAALASALADAVEGSNARSVDVLVHRLRKKLGEGGSIEPSILLTVHGVGYRVGVDVVATR
jgi:two-component system torCAD operon response regulator TorR